MQTMRKRPNPVVVPLRRTPDISAQQVREARALLGWSRERLGALSEVSANFIAVFEKSGRAMTECPSALHDDQLAQVRIALQAAGVEFLGPNESGASVRLVSPRRE